MLHSLSQEIPIAHKLQRIKEQETFRKLHYQDYFKLTNRELEIMSLLVQDFNNPEIALRLHISRYTVEQHRKKINAKLGINTTIQLYKYALAFDLV